MQYYVNPNKAVACYHTIAEAIAALPEDPNEPAEIVLSHGTFHEKVEIRRNNLTITGEGPEETVIVHDDYALMIMPDGSKCGTFRSYTFFLDGDHNRMNHLTIRNNAKPRRKVGQTVALYVDGDDFRAEDCCFDSFQDTLFTGPLPPKAMTPGGFTGPKEFDERALSRQYYKDCHIRGDVDFIFGSAVAYFEHCIIESLDSGDLPESEKSDSSIYGYCTAASTPEGYEFGYVFNRCAFVSDKCPPGSVYLGRPWRDYAKTVLLDCRLGQHIHKDGFFDWNKTAARETIYYAEYDSSGPGASDDTRVSYEHLLTEEEAAKYTRKNVLGF